MNAFATVEAADDALGRNASPKLVADWVAVTSDEAVAWRRQIGAASMSDKATLVMLPAIAITVGDPSGIGPEIAVKASADPRVTAVCRPVIYGPHTAEAICAVSRGRGRVPRPAARHTTRSCTPPTMRWPGACRPS